MKVNRLLVSGSVFVAAWVTAGAALAQSGNKSNTINPDVSGPGASSGGSKSERSGDSSDVPLPKGSPSSGTVEQGRSDSSSGAMSQRNSSANIREAQEALKSKGYDPGPVDGRIGARTKEAIRSFQSASNLEATGTLDAQTAQQLGIQSGDGTTTSRDRMRSNSNTTVGKDMDQPNLPPTTGK